MRVEHQHGPGLSMDFYRSLLKACGKQKSLARAQRLHAHLVKGGLECSRLLGEYVVSTFVKCGGLEDALQVFSRLPQPTAFSWTAVISGYAMNGQGKMALRMYSWMQEKGVTPSRYTFVAVLKACGTVADLEEGKRIHADIVKYRCEADLFVCTSLVDMYGKCGSVLGAQTVFDGLSQPDVVSWNALIVAYAEQGQAEKALQLYEQMQEEGVGPNDRTFVSALQACAMVAEKEEAVAGDGSATKVKSLGKGRAMHAEALRKKCDSDVFVSSTLVSMYAKCWSIVDAWVVFDGMAQRSVVSWNVMLLSYNHLGQPEKTLQLYQQMWDEAVKPDAQTFVTAIQACCLIAETEEGMVVNGQRTKVMSLARGKQLHADAWSSCHSSNVFVGSTLIGMYGTSGSTVDAYSVFDALSQQDVVAWSAMVNAYAHQGEAKRALQLYEQMQEEGVTPDARTFVSAVRACGLLAQEEHGAVADGLCTKVESLNKGKAIHAEAHSYDYDSDVFVGNTLVSMYGKCGSIIDAWNVFDGLVHRDVVSWNALLTAYSEQGQPDKALELYEQMREQGVGPDVWTFVSLLQACGMLSEKGDDTVLDGDCTRSNYLEKGEVFYHDAQDRGYGSDVFLVCALIGLYAKSRNIDLAQHLFDGYSKQDVVAWNAILLAYVQQGLSEQALQLYEQMQEKGVTPNDQTFVTVLQACGLLVENETHEIVKGKNTKVRSLGLGKQIHAEAQRNGYASDVFVGSVLVSFYGKCGSIVDARNVFDGLPQRDVVSWTAMIVACAQQGEPEDALHLYQQMCEEGTSPDMRTCLSVLQACGLLAEKEKDSRVHGLSTKLKSLQMGKAIHADVQNKGFVSDVFVGNTLVSMYGKCGSIVDARNVFDGLVQQNVVACNAMLAAYTDQRQAEDVFELYAKMQEEGLNPDVWGFVSIIQACSIRADKEKEVVVGGQCTKVKTLQRGKAIHAEAQTKSFAADVLVGNALVTMYAKCGSIVDAKNVFHSLSLSNVVAWNALLAAYAQHGHPEVVLQLYEQMQEEGVTPDVRTHLSTLQACGMLAEGEDFVHGVDAPSTTSKYLGQGRVLHADANQKGLVSDVYVGSTLIRMYGKCGSIVDARIVFDGLVKQDDVLSWNAMLMAYVRHGQADNALQLYDRMLEEGVSTDVCTTVGTLQACSVLREKEGHVLAEGKSKSLEKGKSIHADALRRGHDSDVYVNSAIISMYGKCGSYLDAWIAFDQLSQRDVVSWNVMLAAFTAQGEAEKALHLYEQMLEGGISPDVRTLVCTLQACGILALDEGDVVLDGEPTRVKSLEKAKVIHADVQMKGYCADVFVSSTLISTYGKCRSVLDAQNVFDGLSQRDLVSWSAILMAYVDHGNGEKALQLYRQMHQEGMSPDEITLVSILQGCSDKGSVAILQQIHRTVLSSKTNLTPFLASSLIRAYGRCSSMADAQNVFNTLPQPTRVSWNALIAGYARQENCLASLQCYDEMQQRGMTPDGVTFLSVLSACSHAGLMDKGVEYFESMRDHGITPRLEHYVSMVDLFGRAGCFSKVEDLLSTMPMQPNLALWLCLLSACQKHGNVVLGENAFYNAVRLEPKHAAAYLSMANVYAAAGLFHLAKIPRRMREKEGAWKMPGQSWIDHEQEMHTFRADDNNHAQHVQLYDLIGQVNLKVDDGVHILQATW